MKNKLLEIKKIIDELLYELQNENAKEPMQQQQDRHQLSSIEVIKDKPRLLSKDFEVLKNLLFSEKWPEAVFSAQIADENSEKDKEERAEGICDIMLPPLEGKKFLDFGCGEGHAAKYMAKNSALSIGYDIEKNPKSNLKWEEKEDNCLLTTDFEKVKENGPYNAILIYDVLDHTKEDKQVEVLLKAKSVLEDSGSIYLRCHPWTGRHGGHVYKKINKAFAHLIFSQEELIELGLKDFEYTCKILKPIATYKNFIENAGLSIRQEEIDTQEVEPFFKQNPLIKKRILESFEINEWADAGSPAFQMSQCFLDFVLRKK